MVLEIIGISVFLGVFLIWAVLFQGWVHLAYLSDLFSSLLSKENDGLAGERTTVVLSSNRMGQLEVGESSLPLDNCQVMQLISVDNQKVRYGCHGRYTLRRARFYGKLMGGDPQCGGGMKFTFLPRSREWLIRFNNYWAAKKGTPIEGFVVKVLDGEISSGSVYVGERSVVESYLAESGGGLVGARFLPAT